MLDPFQLLEAGRRRKLKAKHQQVLDVVRQDEVRQDEGSAFEHQDPMAMFPVAVKEVLSNDRSKRTAAEHDDVKGPSIWPRLSFHALDRFREATATRQYSLHVLHVLVGDLLLTFYRMSLRFGAEVPRAPIQDCRREHVVENLKVPLLVA
jgi:hypothetical protein